MLGTQDAVVELRFVLRSSSLWWLSSYIVIYINISKHDVVNSLVTVKYA